MLLRCGRDPATKNPSAKAIASAILEITASFIIGFRLRSDADPAFHPCGLRMPEQPSEECPSTSVRPLDLRDGSESRKSAGLRISESDSPSSFNFLSCL